MKVIICGAGQVGTSIAKQLIIEDNDVTVIDQSPKLIDRISDSLDVTAHVGFASHPYVLEKAGANQADMFIAVTQSDEINMVACQVAHSIFGVSKKIARIRSQNYFTSGMERLFSPDDMPIDVIISPELEVANAIFDKLHVPGAIETINFAENLVKVVSVKATDDSLVMGKNVTEVNERLEAFNAQMICFVREQELHGLDQTDIKLDSQDEIYFVSPNNKVKEVMSVFGHEEREASKIRIVGGGSIGLYLSQKLEEEEQNHNIKIIERNAERAKIIVNRLDRTTVINGDALEQEILKEVNIANSDTIIAVSNDDEVNILSALLAKKFGCKKAVSLINSTSFAPLFSSLGIDAIVNPREITVSSILQHIRNFKVRNAHAIADSQAEIIETDAFESSYSVGKTIADLDLPKGTNLNMIIREGKYIIPNAETEIIAKDRLIIFSRVEKLKKIEKIFSDRYKYF